MHTNYKTVNMKLEKKKQEAIILGPDIPLPQYSLKIIPLHPSCKVAEKNANLNININKTTSEYEFLQLHNLAVFPYLNTYPCPATEMMHDCTECEHRPAEALLVVLPDTTS